MLAPLARRIALARPVATALQGRPFTTTPQSNDTPTAKEIADLRRQGGAEIFGDTLEPAARAELGKISEMESELLATASREAEPIDWAAWKKEIRHPTIVDDLQVMYDATPPPDVAADKARMEKAVEDTFAPMIAELEKLAKDAEAEAVEYEKKAQEVAYLEENVATMPVDEFLEKYPAVKASIQKDIEQGKWFQDEAEQ